LTHYIGIKTHTAKEVSMLNQLSQLKTIGCAERINFSIQFLPLNKARVVLTTQVESNAQGELADLLRTPIVLTGSLVDIDNMLTNELFNLSEQVANVQNNEVSKPSQVAEATNVQDDNLDVDELDDDFDDESL